MGVSIRNVLSTAQSNIGDDSMDAIFIGHYVDFCNRIANRVATETQCWIGRYIATPVNDMYSWDKRFKYSTGQIAEFNGMFYIAIENNTNENPFTSTNKWSSCPIWNSTLTVNQNQYVMHNGFIYKATQNTVTEPPSDDYDILGEVLLHSSQVILPYKMQQEIIAPHRIISVSRYDGASYNETTEYSMQSVTQTQKGGFSFRVNTSVLNENSFYTSFVNKSGSVSGDMALHFTNPFGMDERVYIDYISGTPFKLINWQQTPDIQIPEFLEQTFISGLTWLCAEMLFSKGNAYMQAIADRNENRFTKDLREAVGYTRMLRDNSSTLQARPINWLPER
jgi:hypothetical protein